MGSLRSIAAVVLLCGCMGSVPTGGGGGGGGGNGQSDASTGGGQMDAIRWVDAAPGTGNGLPCLNAGTPTIDGHHNEGKDCKSCHQHDAFTVAGTLYTNATGNTGFGSANITITDANGNQTNIVTAPDGNFYTTAAIAFPATILASDCPSATKMNASVTTGHCNQAGCHPGNTSMQMHLP